MNVLRWLLRNPILFAWVLAIIAILLNYGVGGKHQEAAATHAKSAHEATKEHASAPAAQHHAAKTDAVVIEAQPATVTATVAGHTVAPTQATASAQPAAPQAPAQVTESAQPAAPQAPVQATAPAQPAAPQAPVQATAPEQPVAPQASVQATAPAQPVAPQASVQATAPAQPVAPQASVQATAPAQPVAPQASVQATAPAQPVAPQAPAQATAPAAEQQAPAANLDASSEDELLRAAREAYWSNEFGRAAEFYEALLKKTPDSLAYQGELANVYWWKGDSQRAADLFAKLAPKLAQQGRKQEAINMKAYVDMVNPELGKTLDAAVKP